MSPRVIRALTKEVRALRASAAAREDDFKVRELDDALEWLAGRNARNDHKIETRQRDGVWRHTLMYGVLGYSAANPIATVY